MDETNSDARQILGAFEEIVLLAILAIGKDAYGVPISDAIEEASGKRVTTGALYTTLQRLEEKRFISSELGEATNERGGRAKKYFYVENAGKQALDDAEKRRNYLKLGLKTKFA